MAKYFIISLIIFSFACPSYCFEKVLTVLNWSDYIDPSLEKEFEKKYGAKINNIYFNSDETRNKILFWTSGQGVDVIITLGLRAHSYTQLRILRPLKNKIFNHKFIDSKWNSFQKETQGYVSPYFWGTVGIIYRKDKVGKLSS